MVFAWETCKWKAPEGAGRMAKSLTGSRTRAKEWDVRGGADSPGLPAGLCAWAVLSR